MKVIGLTGGIGSGKSSVAQFLAKLGAVVIDTDKVGHEAFKPDTDLWREVVAAFGRQILAAVIKTFGEYRLAVELRHRSWSDDGDTAGTLQGNNVSWVNIDEPKFSSSIAAEVPPTSDTAYFRFHGRNAEMWWRGDNETRYKYLYSANEMKELSDRVKKAAENTNLTFAFFNNHWQGYAPRNAVDLQKTLQLTFKGLPVAKESAEDEIQRLL